VRLFVALVPPTAALAALDAAVGDRDERMRWVPSEQRHLTLVFCGEVAEGLVGGLSERLNRAAARTPPFALRLAGAGTFPNQAARARVLWVGLDGDLASLSRLAERCTAAARRAGIAVDDRPYRPHLTLARARRDPVDARDAVTRLSSYDGQPWTVSSMRLVHSTLGAKVHHETLAEPVLSGSQRPGRQGPG
jgi:2'-5' RNA ligase